MLPQHVEETFLSSNISASACQELVTVYVSAWQCSKTSGKVNLLSRLTIKGKTYLTCETMRTETKELG